MDSEKKECILTAAIANFTRFGFKKTSVDEIAKEAGVAKGTVYLAAESKEDLFFQALHREVREWVAENAKLIDPRVPADELLETLGWTTLAQIEGKKLVWELLAGEHNRLLPQWSDRLDTLRALCSQNTVEVLRLGVKQGRFRPGLDIDAVADLLLDLQISTLLYYNRKGPDFAERVQRRGVAALGLIMDGIREPGAAQAALPVAGGRKSPPASLST
jgi:AcrR family transcriptional regulator